MAHEYTIKLLKCLNNNLEIRVQSIALKKLNINLLCGPQMRRLNICPILCFYLLQYPELHCAIVYQSVLFVTTVFYHWLRTFIGLK